MKKVIGVLLVLLLIFCVGCGKTVDVQDEKSEIPESSRSDSVSEDDVTDPSSFDLIDSDLEDGKLSEEAAVSLKLIAGYAPERLPEKYKSEFSYGRSSLQDAKMWLRYNWDSLDEDTQEKLLPFYVPHSDPRSFIYAEDKNELFDALEIIPSVNAFLLYDSMTVSIDGLDHTIFWKDGDSAAKQRAMYIKDALIKSWKHHKDVLDMAPSDPVQVYLVPSMSDYGTADLIETSSQKYCEVEVKGGQSKEMTEATTAHELFHCFQFYIPLVYSEKSTQWLMESTATWSEQSVYPSHDSEHEYLPTFFNYIGSNMIFYGKNREYGTYVWWFYLTKHVGDQIVKDTLFRAVDSDARLVMTTIDDFDERFIDYILWNWNQDQWKKYPDLPATKNGFRMRPFGKSYASGYYDAGVDEKVEPVHLSYLSAKYYSDKFSDKVKRIKYDFPGIDTVHPRYALIHDDGVWRTEDWTHEESRELCSGKVDEIIFININLEPLAQYDYEYTVDTVGECDPAWTGRLSVSWDTASEKDTSVTKMGKVLKQNKGDVMFRETLQFDPEYEEFYVTARSVTYSGLTKTRSEGDGECGWIFEEDLDTSSGSVSDTYDLDGYPPTRFSLYDDAWEMELSGHQSDTKWITSTSRLSSLWKSCDYGVGYVAAPRSKDESNTIQSNLLSLPLDNIEIELDPDSKRIQGSTTQKVYSDKWGDYDVLIEWDYQYN